MEFNDLRRKVTTFIVNNGIGGYGFVNMIMVKSKTLSPQVVQGLHQHLLVNYQEYTTQFEK